ncbi:hypothetical protein [Leuconostoc palmae]|uniref:hypothetical protein n=1 Tax=Leuconostoc palmae TaxID=501487 RepID=UPI001C7D02CD|nr:hypothetical protein [Leuconostoc palmae]
MPTTILLQLVTTGVSLIGIALSFWFGRLSATADMKKRLKEQRYFKFYMPFFTYLIRHNYGSSNYYQIISSSGKSSELLTMLFDNIGYLDKKTCSKLSHFYQLHLKALSFGSGDFRYEADVLELNDLFDELVNLSTIESSKLAESLKLDQTPLELFSTNSTTKSHCK